MRLDGVAAVIRPRSYPEAVELGFRMVRVWWRPIAGAWAAAGLPLYALLVALFWRQPWIAMLILWWLKPLFDRVPVFVLSRGLFGTVPTVSETLRTWPQGSKRDLVAGLTWMRFDPFRALRLPVWLLEGQRGPTRRRRMRVLGQDVSFEAGLLLVTCVVFEQCVHLGLVVLLLAFHVPAEVQAAFNTDAPLILSTLQSWILLSCWVVAVAVVEPFYVAGGFGLYVNRRTHLEAWDIEVVFRRMAARLGGLAAGAASVVALVAALALATPPAPAAVDAPAAEAPAAAAQPDPQLLIREVLADPDFGSERTERVFRLRDSGPQPTPDAPAWLGAFSEMFGMLVRAVVVIIVGAAVVWGLLHLRLRAPRARPEETHRAPLPAEVAGLDVREASLPVDVTVAARELWDAGRRVEAVRLLYRAALCRLIARDGLAVQPSATEGDCLRLAACALPPRRLDYFGALTQVWLASAYGHREPEGTAGAALIDGFDAHFGEAA